MPQPLLTVVVPVYNVEEYLRECLDSVVNQTYTNLEIIIVNDCTPDNSEEIILEYQAKDPRIKYIKHEKNLGLGGARNTGITNASGDWIAFVDSDDYIDLNTYEYMTNLIQKNNVGIFSAINFDDITKKKSYDPYFNVPNLVELSNLGNVTSWNKIFRLSDIINNGVYFPEHLKHEDVEFWTKYVAVVKPTIIGTPKRFYHYRQREGSIMSNTKTSRADMGYIAQNIYDFLVEKNLLDKHQDIFLKQIRNYGQINRNIPTELHLKLLTVLHDLLQHFSNEELAPYTELFAIKNLPIDENSLEVLKNFRKLSDDKWYKFGKLSHKDKIKFIIKIVVTKIFKKLHIFEFTKSIKNNIFRR